MSSSLGCSHYKRKVKIVAPCCNKVYACRLCHDEKETHHLNRKSIARVVCLVCNEKQGVRNVCIRCGTKFGNYYCAICKLFDDEDKQQFHCNDCGLCRVGGRANFFHCRKCYICLNVRLQGHHKCLEGGSMDVCTVCLEDLHTSTESLSVPVCGHFIHEKCWKALGSNNIHDCPKCHQKFVHAMERLHI